MKEYFTKKNLLIAGGILLLALLANNARAADVYGNAGGYSDYIWRGMNQSQGPSAFLDLGVSTDLGLYGGLWVGQVEFDGSIATEEQDWYIGFNKNVMGVNVDVAYWDYGYRGDSNLDFEEAQVKLGFFDNKLHVLHAVGMDDASDYTEVSFSMFSMADFSYGLVKDHGINWEVSRSMDVLGGSLEVGYAEFIADDNALALDEDGFYIGWSRPLF
tara:strand:+ start:569 stop:1213 length:645 start_codon:yes stop_codon:yes gene_type:complete